MIFRVDNVSGDTCGNFETVGEPEYWEAISVLDVWEKLGKPQMLGYWCGNKFVDGVALVKRTSIEEVWGPNPKCNFERDAGQVTAFKAATRSAFGHIFVEPVKVRQ